MKGKQYWIVLRVQDDQRRLLSKSELYWFRIRLRMIYIKLRQVT